MRRDFEVGVIRFASDYLLTVGEGDRMRLDFEGSYRGRDGVRVFTQSYQDAFGDSAYEPQWIVDLGGDEFVILVHHSLHGRASGASVEQMLAHRLQIRDGLVVREEVHSAPRSDLLSLAQTVGIDPNELARRQSAADSF
jgi:ketosteroid isomerase-like protein